MSAEGEDKPKREASGVNRDGSRSSVVNRKDPKDSFFANLERQKWFENTTLFVIVLNAIWICIDVQLNHARLEECDENGKNCTPRLHPLSTIIENLFCVYFTIEVLIRFCAFEVKWRCIFDGWFVFDTTLVTFMVIETWIIPIIGLFMDDDGGGGVLSSFSSFRLLRLLRLTRMARIMKFFPELMTLVKGMIAAVRSVFFILVFLVIVMYVFAIVFTSALGKPDAPEDPPPDAIEGLDAMNATELRALVLDLNAQLHQCNLDGEDDTADILFATLGDSMMTLFTNGVLGDNLAQTLNAIKNYDDGSMPGLLLMWIFVLFMMLSSFTLLNMLIGVLCQVIADSAAEEEEQRQMSELKKTLEDAFSDIDTSKDNLICQKEWENIKKLPNVRASLVALGVEPNQLEERLSQMQETLFGSRKTEQELQEEEKQKEDGGRTPSKEGVARHGGISFDEFVNKVVELRWDRRAGALDLEMLKSMVKADDKVLTKRLSTIEDCLKQLGQGGGGGGPTAQGTIGGTTAKDHDAHFGIDSSRAEWNTEVDHSNAPLRDVPTELLFHVLKTREQYESKAGDGDAGR